MYKIEYKPEEPDDPGNKVTITDLSMDEEKEENPKPDWWPKCPYPETIFPMKEEKYPEIVPDPDLRTALSGMLGRQFWNVASDEIWDMWKKYLEENFESDWFQVIYANKKDCVKRLMIICAAVCQHYEKLESKLGIKSDILKDLKSALRDCQDKISI